MADDRYNWLDKDAAERLLRGERVGARHGDGARELEQLLQAAAAVGAKAPETVELPGEEAAVAAFRRTAGAAAGAHTRSHGSGEAFPAGRGTAVAERTRLGRPVRRGFAVALAACAIGGVAVAAGTGVLPTPFRGGEPQPASSVSAAESPGPLDTPEPGAQTDGTTESTPDPTPHGKTGGPGDTSAPSSPGDTTPPSSTPGPGHQGNGGTGANPGKGDKKNLLLSLCQSYASGKRGGMDRDALRRLEQKAGGADQVLAFCRAYLARYQHPGSSGGGSGLGTTTGGTGSTSGVTGGEDDEGHPSQSPGATPSPGTSTPAPSPTATDPVNAATGAAPAT